MTDTACKSVFLYLMSLELHFWLGSVQARNIKLYYNKFFNKDVHVSQLTVVIL